MVPHLPSEQFTCANTCSIGGFWGLEIQALALTSPQLSFYCQGQCTTGVSGPMESAGIQLSAIAWCRAGRVLSW